MENVTYKNSTFKMSTHAIEQCNFRFKGVNVQDAIGRGKMVDSQNSNKYGQLVVNKMRTMSEKYSTSTRLIINTHFNTAFAVDINTKIVITALYLDGTWSL